MATTVKLVPAAYTLSNTQYLTIADEDNMYTNVSSTTYGTCTHNRASTNSTYYLYLHNFNFGTVPSNATVSSFSIKIKASATGHTTSTNSSYKMSLYHGTTSISSTTASSALSTTENTFTFPNGSLDWATLSGYGNDFRIRVPLRRASSNTADVVSIYGAEIEVTYSLPIYHDITIMNSTSATVTASETHPLEGSDVDIVADTLSGITVKDNGTDVTSQFVNGLTETVYSYPTSYQTGGSINGTNYQSTIGKGSDTSNRTGNDYFSTTQGGSGSTWIDYYFTFSIPSGATIQSTSLTVKGHCESTSQSREISQVQAYTGTTAKGSATDMTDSTTDKVYTVSIGTWTASELASAKLRHTIGVYGGLVSGATWTVTYEIDGYIYTISNVIADHTITVTSSGGGTDTIWFKNNGSWVSAVKVYKKVNGSWVQQSDLTNVFDPTKNYVRE